MSHLDLISCRKRKRGERVFKFNTFGEQGYPVEFDGSFRQNVKNLLEFGHFEGLICDGSMPSWSFQLEVNRHPPFHVFLFVVEEPVEASIEQHCRRCKYVGWGHHLICNKKYHFVLPSKDSVTNFMSCYNDDSYDGPILSNCKFNFVEFPGGHIMHGVFHSNGFGHLLCVNGMEAGSNLAGEQIMEFWDRLCVGLRSRRVSLIDTSQKKSMELRLLHGIGYGDTWFGRWGYKFGRGSFGVTQSKYRKAIETIQGIPLCILLRFLGNTNDIQNIFSRYQTLSGHLLATLGDLFHFMLELKPRLPDESQISSNDIGVIWEPNCRWSPKRVEMAIRVIVEALKQSQLRWVPRQEVRDAARVYIGDTGLLDFVLKSLGNHIVGNYLVRRSLNPVTKVLEYCLEDGSNVFPEQQGLAIGNSKAKARYKMTRSQLIKDVAFLYKYILQDPKPMLNIGILSAIPTATRIILDTKHLVKEYNGETLPELELQGKLTLYCSVVLRDNVGETQQEITREMPPFECVMLKSNATFHDLKLEVERNFRELYWGLRGFIIDSVMNMNVKDRDSVFGVVEVGRKLVFEGSNKERAGGLSMIHKSLAYEGEFDDKVMDCPCGALEDDGERLVTCDICEVWQHTRCVGIPNSREIPHVFLCNRCEHEISILPSLP